VLFIDRPLLMNIEYIEGISKGTCPTIVDAPEITWGSFELPGSHLHLSSSFINKIGHIV